MQRPIDREVTVSADGRGDCPRHWVGDFGAARAKHYSLLAPLFSAKGSLLTVTGFRGALTVHMSYDGVYLDAESAASFLSQFCDHFVGLVDV